MTDQVPAPSNNEIKQAFAYALTVASQGKLTVTPAEAATVLKNLEVAGKILNAIPVDPEPSPAVAEAVAKEVATPAKLETVPVDYKGHETDGDADESPSE